MTHFPLGGIFFNKSSVKHTYSKSDCWNITLNNILHNIYTNVKIIFITLLALYQLNF